MLADEIRESGIKFEYWHLRFTELTMTPTVDLSLEPGLDKLLVSCMVTDRKQQCLLDIRFTSGKSYRNH